MTSYVKQLMVCVVAIFATALAGCAETPIDRSSVASLRSIALVGPSDPAMYSALNSTVGIIGVPVGAVVGGAIGGTIAGASLTGRTDFNATVRSMELHLGNETRAAILSALKERGYNVVE